MSGPSLVQRLAALVSGAIGRDSGVIRRLRPIYEWMLDTSTSGRGFQRTVNQHETFFVHPRYRGLFPPTYEPAVADFLRARVKPGSVCFDVGAHVGVFALSLARWTGPSGRVVAFEPNPETRAVLWDHIRRNALESVVQVRSEAVSDQPGTATLHVAALEGTNRLGSPNPAAGKDHRAVTVPVTTLDAFCAEHGVRPDWLLLDIEGFEGHALRGARTILARAEVVVELHPALWESAGTSRAAFSALLAELGYSPVPLTGQRDALGEAGVVYLKRG